MTIKYSLVQQASTPDQPGFELYEDAFDSHEDMTPGPLFLKLVNVPIEMSHSSKETEITVSLERKTAYRIGQELHRIGKAAGFGDVDEDRLQMVRSLTVLDAAVELFGTRAAAVQWIYNPHYGLGGHCPVDFLDTDQGLKMVLEQIQQQRECAPL